MCDIKTINKALKLLEQYDYKFVKVSRKLGIKVTTLRSWYKKKVNNKNNYKVIFLSLIIYHIY